MLFQLSHFIDVGLHQWALVIFVDLFDDKLRVAPTMSFLIPRSAVILRPASSPSYLAVLFVDTSLGKCIWITYLRCSLVGATSSTPAPAPYKEKAPSKYMIQSQLASLPGRAVSWVSSSGVAVHSTTNSARTRL